MNSVIALKYVFVGNRRFVLEEMLSKDLKISAILVAKGTHLENDVRKMDLKYNLFDSKSDLLNALKNLEYDVLVSNGCPYILPISELKSAKYINVHPSFLPDLKGVDPIIGSVLKGRDAGATCHVMDDTVDGGDIIAQIKIPYTDDLDVSLAYQLGFKAEKQAFNNALGLNFISQKKQKLQGNEIYYTRSNEDRQILKEHSCKNIISKCRAFNNKSQGAILNYNQVEYVFHEADILENPYLLELANNLNEDEVIFNYEGCIIFKHLEQVIRLRSYTQDVSSIEIGSALFS